MSKWINFLTTLVVGSTVSLSAWDSHYCGEPAHCEPVHHDACCDSNSHSSTVVQFDAGYRQDSMSWNFKAPSRDPILGSNIRLKDIHIFQVGFCGKSTYECAYIRGGVSAGWVLDGDYSETLKNGLASRNPSDIAPRLGHQDCDNIDTVLTATSNSVVDGRYVADMSIAIGYPFYFCSGSLQLAPLVGYSYNEQNYRIDECDKAFFTGSPEPFVDGSEIAFGQDVAKSIKFHRNDCCDVKLISRWWGPFIGFDLNYNPCDCWSLFGAFEAHWAHFKGIRESSVGFCPFDDFNRSSHDAHGYVARFGANYDFCDCWYFGMNFTYQDWTAHTKSHLSDFAYGNAQFSNSDRFRADVKLHSWAVNAAVGRHF